MLQTLIVYQLQLSTLIHTLALEYLGWTSNRYAEVMFENFFKNELCPVAEPPTSQLLKSVGAPVIGG